VSLGAAVMGLFAWPTVWTYLLAQVVAGIAGLSFLALNPHDK
jgi:aquaporin Z